MRTIGAIAAEIASTNDPEQEWSKLAGIASEIESNPDGVQALLAVFELYERFPEADFGVPGPLAHAIGRYYGHDYVQLLAESLERRPTEQTLFLAERVMNARDQFSPQMLPVLNAISLRSDVEAILRDEALRILARHV